MRASVSHPLPQLLEPVLHDDERFRCSCVIAGGTEDPDVLRETSGPPASRYHRRSIGISDNLLDLLNYSPRPQNTTDDTVNEGDQSHDTDDRTHEIVERK